MIRFTLCGILATISIAHAEAVDNPGWAVEKNEDGTIATLFTTDTDETGIGFRCINGRLVTVLSDKPNNIEKMFDSTRKARAREFQVTIGDEIAAEQDLLYSSARGVIIVSDPALSRDLFNAAARGEEISVRDAKKDGGKVEIAKPAADAETFNDFMKSCGYTT